MFLLGEIDFGKSFRIGPDRKSVGIVLFSAVSLLETGASSNAQLGDSTPGTGGLAQKTRYLGNFSGQKCQFHLGS
jgi:hypothetical protein